MKEIGAILKAAREEKGITLDEVQMVTKIRYKHLEALEAGDFGLLPGEVYVKGFLVNFAKAVDLDGEEILQKYHDLKRETAQTEIESSPEEGSRKVAPPPETVTIERIQAADKVRKIPLPVMAGVGVVLVAGIGFWALFASKPAVSPGTDVPSVVVEEETGTNQSVVDEEAEALPTGNKETEPTTTEVPTKTREEPENKPTTPSAISKLELVAEASEVVWMGIYQRASGEMVFEGTLYPGEQREWVLTEDVMLRIGNAGGIKLIYQGQDLGALGYSGQVINKVLTVE